MVDPFASDLTPGILWRLPRGEHVMEARLIPHAQHVSIIILVDGRGRAAKGFEHQTDALRWAKEQRVLHAGGDR
jgi:hypothetical protein